ncbi:hypothetical protein NDU88_003620 [Pleurodeles waltl]|uniref:Uncharacterized protein n=1 Tax=Pleurodeles waltl TaxID=8319 RepID=A0AAV7UES3_PLEWA|nr:hypothetical protein NDU88_003620 [Pleurodeles waltl]
MGLEENEAFMSFLVVGNFGVALVCVRKDGEFLLLDNPGEVLCKWLVENIDESGRPITGGTDFKAMVLFQSLVKKQCLMIQRISEDLFESYSGTMEGLKQVLLQRAQKEKQLLMECGSRGRAGRLKRVLREPQEEEITVKRCKEKIKAKQSGQDMIKVANQTPGESTASQPGDASSQMNLQKLQNLALLAGMATVLHPKSTSEYEVERENETVLETPLQFKDQGLKHAFSFPRHQFIPKQLFPMQELAGSSNEVTPSQNDDTLGTKCFNKTDMQQLVKDANDPDLFRNVLVPKRELHKLLEDAKAARGSACFLLNGVSEILFSLKELAAAKGVTKAHAGTAALDEKVDALFSKKH